MTVAMATGDSVVDIAATATLREAARELAEQLVGVLLVVRASGTAGILSERDVVRAIAEGADPDEERVGDWCTDELVRCAEDTTVAEAIEVMQRNEVRHIVVDTANGEARVVSMRRLIGQGPVLTG